MKMFAIEKEMEGAKLVNAATLLEQEAHHVFHLYLTDSLREIYFTKDKNAVLILETIDRITAKELLDTLPLVKAGKIRFDMLELRPYSGYEK
jgi:hypothetical protein